MDNSKYTPGESLNSVGQWLIEHMTNLDPASLTPYQETMVSGSAIIMLLVVIAIVFG